MTAAQDTPLGSVSPNTWRVFSVLLDYPDRRLMDELDRIRAAVKQISEPTFQRAASAFAAYLEAHDLLRLQETYTVAFDLHPSTTLNLTYHAFGDNEKRAAALSALQHLYVQTGWERTNTELPDYLPLMLEFLSIHPRPEPDAAEQLRQCLAATHTLMNHLEKDAPAYAGLLAPLAGLAHAGMKHTSRKPDLQDGRMTPPSFAKGGPT